MQYIFVKDTFLNKNCWKIVGDSICLFDDFIKTMDDKILKSTISFYVPGCDIPDYMIELLRSGSCTGFELRDDYGKSVARAYGY